MRVTITKLRQQLFHLADEALKGELVEFTYRGVVFRVVPEAKTSKLARLTGQRVVSPGENLEQAGQELFREMEAEWEKDWSEL